MKKILIAFSFLLTFQLYAQIPDSLEVEVPWEIINIPSCDATMGEGPKTENSSVFIALDSDSLHINDAEECFIRVKKWVVLDWNSGEIYDVFQLGKVVPSANTNCESEIYLQKNDLPITMQLEDFLLEMNPGHEYGFSYSDENFDILQLDGGTEDNIEVYVYDFTDMTVCKTNVFLTDCEDQITITYPDELNIEFNGEIYFELTLESLEVEIDIPCDTYTTKISVNGTGKNVLYAQAVGKTVPVKVTITLGSGIKYVKTIDVIVTGVKPPPVAMFIEEKNFVAGETIQLDVWSEEIVGLVAWQLQLDFENVEVLGLETSTTFDHIPSNIVDNNTLRALWFPSDGISLDVETDATWFTLELKPTIDGSTFDIFQTGQDPWSLIGIEDENYIYEYEADFIFNVAPRNFLSSTNQEEIVELEVYPNPSSHEININLNSAKNSKARIEIFDTHGKLMKAHAIYKSSNERIEISDLASGLYFINIYQDKSVHTKKFIKH